MEGIALQTDVSVGIALFPDGPRAAALAASTIALAHSLDLRMVAEGVESATTYAELTDTGCDAAQGYYMCPPVSATQLARWQAVAQATASGTLPGADRFTD